MSRYIDTQYLFKCETCRYCMNGKCYTYCNCGESYLPDMNKIPTADVVEVVRCKDCKHLEIINSREIYAKCKATGLEFKPFDIDTCEHYCSYGERREENER